MYSIMRYFKVEQLFCVVFIYFTNAQSGETLCLSDVSLDVPTVALRTVSADGVFEGRPKELPTSPVSGGLPLNVTFSVVKVYKGKTIPFSQTVVVEIQNIWDGENNESCLYPRSTDLYVVFVNQTSSPLDRLYFPSGQIMPATDGFIEQVKDYVCAKCGLPVKVRLPKYMKVREGAKLKLRCRTRGKPKPKIYWSKGGQALVFDGHVKLVDRLGSTLRINKVRLDDEGIYQCFASTAIANSSVASTSLMVSKARFPTSIHGELCRHQDYCLNNGRCYFLRTLGKKYCACAKGFTGNHCKLRDMSIFVNELGHESLSGIEYVSKTFVVCAVVIGSILLAAVIILTFCIIRLCRKRKLARLVDDKALNEQSSDLPDGHQTVVNVKRLSCVLSQQSACDFDGTRPSATLCFPGNSNLDRVQEEEPTTTTTTTTSGPAQTSWSGSRLSGSRLPASNKEQKLLNRLSAASDDVTSRCQSWISGNRLSMNSDRFSYSSERPTGRQFPTSRSNIGVARLGSNTQGVERLLVIPAVFTSDKGPLHDLPESGDSAGTPYCLPPENSEADYPAEMVESVEIMDKEDHHQSDLEVNFESEADILGMEMSGDEINEGAHCSASQNFSELSIPTNDNRSLLTTDSEDSTLSITEDQALLRRLSEYPFINSDVFNHPDNIHGSGSDLSWDESADVPSFAHPNLMYSGHS